MNTQISDIRYRISEYRTAKCVTLYHPKTPPSSYISELDTKSYISDLIPFCAVFILGHSFAFTRWYKGRFYERHTKTEKKTYVCDLIFSSADICIDCIVRM